MNRRVFLMGVAGAAGCMRDARPRLNVYNWSAYVAPETVPNFEKEFGVRVRYATYESNEEMLAKVMTGNSGWDIVFPTHNRLLPMREEGLISRLRHEWLPNLGNLSEQFRAPVWDSHLEWGVPYLYNATGIIYNRGVTPAPTCWGDLWSERLKGRLTMLDDPEDMLGACLKKLHLPFSSTDPGELRRAEQEAIAQKHLLRAYLNAEVRDQVVAGDVLVAQAWEVTAEKAIEAAANLAFVYPAEGFPLYVDNAVILRESGRVELAHRFIDYLLRPDVAAGVAAYTKTGTANASGRALLPAAIRDNPTIFPGPEIFARGEWPGTLPAAAQKLRDRIWTEIKSA